METALFDYELPESYIAQQPAEPRDSSRLMVLHRADGRIEHRIFREIGEYLRAGDLLVANDSRVIPARLHGRKSTGGEVEIFLLRQRDEAGKVWECLVRGRGLKEGTKVHLNEELFAEITAVTPTGARIVEFSASVHPYLDVLGEVPLPPYITQYTGDRERYQTVYSRPEGSVAAPTAGLHFTPELLMQLRQQGVLFETVTLHVGLDTFKPVQSERVEDHHIHTEWAELSSATARRINETTLAGGRIVAVGTTTVRTLEWAATAAQGLDPYDTQACPWQRVAAFMGDVSLFIYPGYRFRAVDALITNFHLPRSSLLMLVSAFIAQAHPEDVDAGRRILLNAYEEAKRTGYRFFSFGDAMLIL
ncbi:MULTISPECIES: tRNA preQ1(34) S-adenosylmethionine ribosyltransferase-isomerase QueA [Caldilinea]|jgi:S-adenosylmethionine:tRNA ribosyltransferase-isomerase|uniref:S-adenosylmethionine:tRNA ribosyltransferase-isomerase n=1 Tax=Caldilinea aerophila (strain DSM 14535 / JCM 11387 / NBRC 104270 / STL-6-O1) TaxID=926550 RepID=I0I5J1_CALAS|nr:MULTISPECIES: tRNA preQ1(34) S-adenosylmethionine ribosyltransferase-isomerase QueA [Caldilinea]BAM00529.1 S-adenosylmethionine--tRNA ribosyltransferase-isomerase [Caldilinea aerophila DSM 14535 = NBRC 104270]GIV71882.1 MAG: S-adenosylmethionine:tRNA ribosyltransferase-isomerase [Caldilinea sp.]